MSSASLTAKRADSSSSANSFISSPANIVSATMSPRAFLIITRYKLLYPDWRGYLIAGFSLVWVANIYMGIFGRLRLDLRKERDDITAEESIFAHSK